MSETFDYRSTLFADGFEDAIIGIDTSDEPYRIVYCKTKMIEILMEGDDLSEEDAIDYLGFNTWCAYVGDGTPIYIESADFETAKTMVREGGYWEADDVD